MVKTLVIGSLLGSLGTIGFGFLLNVLDRRRRRRRTKAARVHYNDNGTTFAVDAAGFQVPHAQRPWLTLALAELEAAGTDPTRASIRDPLGRPIYPFRVPRGWNWQYVAPFEQQVERFE